MGFVKNGNNLGMRRQHHVEQLDTTGSRSGLKDLNPSGKYTEQAAVSPHACYSKHLKMHARNLFLDYFRPGR